MIMLGEKETMCFPEVVLVWARMINISGEQSLDKATVGRKWEIYVETDQQPWLLALGGIQQSSVY